MFFDFGSTATDLWYFDDVIGRGMLTTSTEEVTIHPVTFFPNPTTGQIQVDLNGLFSQSTDFIVQVVDTQGKVKHTESRHKNGEQFTLDLGQLPNGTYFIRLMGKGVHYVKPVIKTH